MKNIWKKSIDEGFMPEIDDDKVYVMFNGYDINFIAKEASKDMELMYIINKGSKLYQNPQYLRKDKKYIERYFECNKSIEFETDKGIKDVLIKDDSTFNHIILEEDGQVIEQVDYDNIDDIVDIFNVIERNWFLENRKNYYNIEKEAYDELCDEIRYKAHVYKGLVDCLEKKDSKTLLYSLKLTDIKIYNEILQSVKDLGYMFSNDEVEEYLTVLLNKGKLKDLKEVCPKDVSKLYTIPLKGRIREFNKRDDKEVIKFVKEALKDIIREDLW